MDKVNRTAHHAIKGWMLLAELPTEGKEVPALAVRPSDVGQIRELLGLSTISLAVVHLPVHLKLAPAIRVNAEGGNVVRPSPVPNEGVIALRSWKCTQVFA